MSTQKTESYIAEEAVRRSEGKLRTIFDHKLVAIYMCARDGIILQVNTVCEHIFGLTPEFLLRSLILKVLVRLDESECVQDIVAGSLG